MDGHEIARFFHTFFGLPQHAWAGFLGGTLGMWFWFRVAPVPDALDQPFSRGRWFLVGAHAALIVAGMVFIEAAHRA